jgi:hypothetical protein
VTEEFVMRGRRLLDIVLRLAAEVGAVVYPLRPLPDRIARQSLD